MQGISQIKRASGIQLGLSVLLQIKEGGQTAENNGNCLKEDGKVLPGQQNARKPLKQGLPDFKPQKIRNSSIFVSLKLS